MNNDILRSRVSTIFAVLFFVLAMTLGDGLYTFATILFSAFAAWYAASGVARLASEKQVLTEATV